MQLVSQHSSRTSPHVAVAIALVYRIRTKYHFAPLANTSVLAASSAVLLKFSSHLARSGTSAVSLSDVQSATLVPWF